eukprot:8409143-Alexandrium_andersonii.AAC.1
MRHPAELSRARPPASPSRPAGVLAPRSTGVRIRRAGARRVPLARLRLPPPSGELQVGGARTGAWLQ